jgi:hypothetical protein
MVRVTVMVMVVGVTGVGRGVEEWGKQESMCGVSARMFYKVGQHFGAT